MGQPIRAVIFGLVHYLLTIAHGTVVPRPRTTGHLGAYVPSGTLLLRLVLAM
ncbi:putative membrane protein [Ochrobactrum quorumnocens]|uniref:Putative membrane protein n=1 Tax=Ochrobactrum quorumnocens TaxID=271865 RepID=A0A248UEL0_9HYPH|nr:hypothetical protein [[Ochrobactrum] quorumnocens]ASV84841.1 putative membrane protein [[Ochrobactrum] quorumnocens]